MRHPIDVEARVSPELSRFIENLVNDPDREDPPALKDVRTALQEGGMEETLAAEMHPQERESAVIELDDLIAEYGEDMLAVSFVAAKASEALSRTIEAAAGDVTLPDEPTWGPCARRWSTVLWRGSSATA